MKNLVTYSIFFAFLLGSCNSGNDTSTETDAPAEMGIMERLDVPQFQKKLAETENPQLIDVRTPEEHAQGTIPGCVNIDFHGDDFETQIGKLDKNRPVFVFCQAGGRSLKTAKRLQILGFKEVYELETGYSGWEQ